MLTRTKVVGALGAAIILAVAARWFLAEPSITNTTAPAAVPVRVVSVERQDIADYASGIGRVVSLHSVAIRTQVDGTLKRLHVKEGQWVKAGDLLATIDDRSILASLAEAKAQLGQSQAQLNGAAIDLKRYRQLIADNGVSRQTFDQQQALFNQLKATVAGNKAAIAAAEVQLSHTQIRSPVTGRVGIRNVDEGNFLRVSDAQGMFSVTQIAPIAVEFSLPQRMLPILHRLLDAPEAAHVTAFVSESGQEQTMLGEGRLTLVDNQISANTGTLRVKAEFQNDEQKLWPGQLVNVRVQTAIYRDALVVPAKSVLRGLDDYFVYRLDNDIAEMLPVKVVHQSSDVFIIEGAQHGDVVVSDGQSRLKPGAKIVVLGDVQPSGRAIATRANQ